MVPVLNSLGIKAALYGNHEFGEYGYTIQLLMYTYMYWMCMKRQSLHGYHYTEQWVWLWVGLIYGNFLLLDFGIDNLLKIKSCTNFPWLMSNVKDRRLPHTQLAEGEKYLVLEWADTKVRPFHLIGCRGNRFHVDRLVYLVWWRRSG